MPKYLYLLAFSVVNPNGAYHELKVKVKHDGLTVQARRGYVALKIRIKKLDFPRTLREGNRVANLESPDYAEIKWVIERGNFSWEDRKIKNRGD